jgi:hypothetical protein
MFSHIITYDLSLPCRLGLSLICAFICGRVLTMTEKLLRYHRPILEDGEIRYDFFYKQGQTMIHPALDRCCFILEHDGVKIHWLTDRERDSTDADPANRIVEADAQRGPRPLPLMQNEWNALSLKLTIEQQQDGVRVSLDKNKGLQHLQPRVQVKGDFDIEVQFRDLKIDDVYNKTTGIALVLFFDSNKGDNCGFYRRYQGYTNDGLTNHHRLLFAHKQTDPDGNLVYSGTPVAEESTSGRIRIARRGRTLSALYAEGDSPFYRIVTTRQISADGDVLAPIRLLSQAPGETSVKVVWQKRTIRAEEIIEGPGPSR